MPYIDPGTLMPVASALAVVGGVALMFWRRIVSVFRGATNFVRTQVSRLFSRR